MDWHQANMFKKSVDICKKQMEIFCGNNSAHSSLKINGGQLPFGTHDQCFKKGYGIGYNAQVTDATKFIAEWGGPYKPHIVQKLIYGSGNVPPGYQRATLAQSLQRGFGFGRVARAKKMSRKSRTKSVPKNVHGPLPKKPTLPIRAR